MMAIPDNGSIHNAVISKNIDDVIQLVLSGVDVNCRAGYNGMTPLHYAVMIGAHDIIEWLLQHDADTGVKDEKGNVPIHMALHSNDPQTVELLVRHGADVNAQNDLGLTLLHLSSGAGYIELVNILLEFKADLNIQNDTGNAAIHLSTIGNHTEILQLLLEKLANIDAQANNGTTALLKAVTNGSVEIIELLLHNKANPNIAFTKGRTALHVAVVHKNRDIVSLLVSQGANVNAKQDNGATPLMIAAENGSVELIELLLGHSADPNIASVDGDTALHIAVAHKHKEIVSLLVTRVSNVNATQENGATPLMAAAENGSVEIIECLLDHSADPNIELQAGGTALHVAVAKKHKEIVLLLVSKGADVNAHGDIGATALMIAAENGSIELIELLLGHNADPNIVLKNHQTALHVAVARKHNEIVSLLIGGGAQLNIQSETGTTALMIATENGSLEIIQLLLHHNADPNLALENGRTALHAAVALKNNEIVSLLIDGGVQVNLQSETGSTALMIGSQNGSFEIVQLLLHHNADPNLALRNGNTALHFAVVPEHKEIVSLLIEKGANLSTKSETGATALMLAAENGSNGIVELLLLHNADPNIALENGHTALHIAALHKHTRIVSLLIDGGAAVNAQLNPQVAPHPHSVEIPRLLIHNPDPPHIASIDEDIEIIVGVILKDNGSGATLHAEAGITPLMISAQNGSVDIMEILLSHNADPNIALNDGCTALHMAANFHSELAVELLLEHGARVNAKNDLGISVLHIVCRNGMVDLLFKLLTHPEIDLNISNNEGDRPIHLAALSNKWNIVKLLIENGAEINMQGYEFKTCLHHAARQGDLSQIKYLIEAGAASNVVDSSKQTPVFVAALFGHVKCVQFLLDHCSDLDINHEGFAGRTLLHVAASCKNLEMVNYLLECGSDVNAIDYVKKTALHSALLPNNINIVTRLLEAGSDVNAIDERGRSVLHLAAELGDVQLLVVLLDAKADVNLKDKAGDTALHLVVRERHFDAIKLLVKRGGNRHILNDSGESPADNAVSAQTSDPPEDAGSIFAAILLLGREDLSTDQMKRMDEYPLHYAIEEEDYEALEYFLSLKVMLRQIDRSRNSCLHTAAMKSCRAVELVVDGIKRIPRIRIPEFVNRKNIDDNTPLHLAAYRCGRKGVAALLSCDGIDLNVQNMDGQTPMHIAILSGQSDCVKALLHAKCNLELQDKSQDTPLRYAMRRVVELGNAEKSKMTENPSDQDSSLIDTARNMVLDLISHGAKICTDDPYYQALEAKERVLIEKAQSAVSVRRRNVSYAADYVIERIPNVHVQGLEFGALTESWGSLADETVPPAMAKTLGLDMSGAENAHKRKGTEAEAHSAAKRQTADSGINFVIPPEKVEQYKALAEQAKKHGLKQTGGGGTEAEEATGQVMDAATLQALTASGELSGSIPMSMMAAYAGGEGLAGYPGTSFTNTSAAAAMLQALALSSNAGAAQCQSVAALTPQMVQWPQMQQQNLSAHLLAKFPGASVGMANASIIQQLPMQMQLQALQQQGGLMAAQGASGQQPMFTSVQLVHPLMQAQAAMAGQHPQLISAAQYRRKGPGCAPGSRTLSKMSHAVGMLPDPVSKSSITQSYCDQIEVIIDGKKLTVTVMDLEEIRTLGRSRCATVKSMRHKTAKCIFAVKIMRWSNNSEQQQQCIKRDLNLSMLSSKCPYIITSYGTLFHEDDIWTCMELLDISMDNFYMMVGAQHKVLPEDLLAYISYCVVSALKYLHSELHVMHRNVRPSRILADKLGRVKVFVGYVEQLEIEFEHTSDLNYLAPEWIDGKGAMTGYDIKSDVWSLGITLLELAMGRFPYQGWATPLCLGLQQLIDGIDKPSPTLPYDTPYTTTVQRFIDRCLNKTAELRPNYIELLEDPFLTNLDFGEELPKKMATFVVEILSAAETGASCE